METEGKESNGHIWIKDPMSLLSGTSSPFPWTLNPTNKSPLHSPRVTGVDAGPDDVPGPTGPVYPTSGVVPNLDGMVTEGQWTTENGRDPPNCRLDGVGGTGEGIYIGPRVDRGGPGRRRP